MPLDIPRFTLGDPLGPRRVALAREVVDPPVRKAHGGARLVAFMAQDRGAMVGIVPSPRVRAPAPGA